MGRVHYDVAYGGAFYAIVDADKLNLSMDASNYSQLVQSGMRFKNSIMKSQQITHQFEDDRSFLYETIFTGRAVNSSHHSRNVCIFANGELDRSATKSGVSAWAALHRVRGELNPGGKHHH